MHGSLLLGLIIGMGEPSVSLSCSSVSATEAFSVYVHAPFCARRCVYCDFAVTVQAEGDLDGWVQGLRSEIALLQEENLFVLADQLKTLYVGGGTPSLLGRKAMAELAGVIGSKRLTSQDLEWTAEANPESFSSEVAEEWKAVGVNRISLGAQTFDAAALKWMGRLHGVEGPTKAIEAARGCGIENVSIDLIFGLPIHIGRSWEDDLRRVIDLDVPHISLYGLTVEPGTHLGKEVLKGREPAVDEDQYRKEFLMAAEALTASGYRHYEVSNFARPGFESRHNTAYWSGDPYLGLGNSAHSFAPPVRRWNLHSWEHYRAAVDASRSPEADREILDEAASRLERVWLDLRTIDGMPRPVEGTPQDRLARDWIERGLAGWVGDRCVLTPEGWLILDQLAVEYETSALG
jgi:oxygen-independent coproporphyrinogen-3 oxidase